MSQTSKQTLLLLILGTTLLIFISGIFGFVIGQNYPTVKTDNVIIKESVSKCPSSTPTKTTDILTTSTRSAPCNSVYIESTIKSTIPGWKLYENNQYNFAVSVPQNFIIISEKISSIPDSEVIRIMDEDSFDILSILPNTSNEWRFDEQKKTFILETYWLTKLSENCTEPFFNNKALPTATTIFGEGWDYFINYNFFTNYNKGITIQTNDVDPAYYEVQPPKGEIQKLKDSKLIKDKILKTFKFINNTRAVIFKCKLSVDDQQRLDWEKNNTSSKP